MVIIYKFDLLDYSVRFVYTNTIELNHTYNHRLPFAYTTYSVTNFDFILTEISLTRRELLGIFKAY